VATRAARPERAANDDNAPPRARETVGEGARKPWGWQCQHERPEDRRRRRA
jgi:hypothetical protein